MKSRKHLGFTLIELLVVIEVRFSIGECGRSSHDVLGPARFSFARGEGIANWQPRELPHHEVA